LAWDPLNLGSFELPKPIDEKLFFAGEATARAYGTGNGAYWSGIRAAREVASALDR